MEKKSKNIIQKTRKISRRQFLAGTAATAAFTIVPRRVLGGTGYTPPSEKLNIAGVGIGGMGKSNITKMAKLTFDSERKLLPVDEDKSDVNIVALCDVDHNLAAWIDPG